MRPAIAVLGGLALTAIASLAGAQKAGAPPAPGFEYLGTVQVQTGTRTVVDNGPQGTRTIVQILGGRFDYNGIGQTTAAGASLRAAPLFETGDARYAWLTKLQAIAVGERVGTDVKYNVYALK
ncbi:MAG: hypothetical protein DMF87_07035 [Acidobacteria bacterium]|nr:MAG: hypothetical protein DMF87_07035 [Acidobacteriota bacterium]